MEKKEYKKDWDFDFGYGLMGCVLGAVAGLIILVVIPFGTQLQNPLLGIGICIGSVLIGEMIGLIMSIKEGNWVLVIT